MAPTIPFISAIITFLAHTAAGNNLTAAQVSINHLKKKQLIIMSTTIRKDTIFFSLG